MPQAPPKGRPIRTALLVGTLVVVLGLLSVFAVRVHELASGRKPPPAAPAPAPLRAVSDLRQVPITITTRDWKKERRVVTVDRLRADRTLWRQMHLGDWDKVPRTIREGALEAMVRAYAVVLEGAAVWPTMSAAEWDGVPHPIRAMAYLRMIWYWAREEALGQQFGLRPERLAATVGGIVMAESWFEHRAVNENPWGNSDLGLAQCSDYCRAEIEQMAQKDQIAFTPTESDYFDPWTATRVATVWFERELLRAEGDVELAIRAYHRGIDNAMDEKGDVYFARVARLRENYIRTQRTSASWRFLTRLIGRR